MGRATILGGGTDGRYTIEVDYGSAQRAALLAAFGQLVARYDTSITNQQAEMTVLQQREQELQTQLIDISNGIIPTGFVGEGEPAPKELQRTIFDLLRRAVVDIKLALQPLQLNLERLRTERASAQAKIAALNAANPTVTKQAWCTTYTEDGAGQVATIDINGESTLTLVAPEARPWTPADGVMTMPHVMSPEQSFFNTAILPGWQKHKPRYRWGTITGLNYDEDTANVELAPATSSAQNLNINLFDTLTDIPVVYLTCNARAFQIGDRCVVEFVPGLLPGDLDARVIGFLDNPKPCGWPALMATVNQFNPHPTDVSVYFKSTQAAFDRIYEASVAGALQVTWRINGVLSPHPAVGVFNPPPLNHTYGYSSFETTTQPGVFYQLTLGKFPGGSVPFTHLPPRPVIILRGYQAAPRGSQDPQVSIETIFEVGIRIAGRLVFNAAIRVPAGTGPVTRMEVKSSGGLDANWPPPGYPTASFGSASIPVVPLNYTLTAP